MSGKNPRFAASPSVTLLCLALAACDGSRSVPPSSTTSEEPKQGFTYPAYFPSTAALARLQAVISERHGSPAKSIVSAVPAVVATVQSQAWLPGGWVFTIVAADGSTMEATVGVGGNVEVSDAKSEVKQQEIVPIADWHLDDLEAQLVAFVAGVRPNLGPFQIQLTVQQVESVGARLLWIGPWHLGGSLAAAPQAAVDATSGDVYIRDGTGLMRRLGSGDQYSRTSSIWQTAQGKCAETVTDVACLLRFRTGSGNWLYNRTGLLAKIAAIKRDPPSTTGYKAAAVWYAALGDWLNALDMADAAVRLDGADEEALFYRAAFRTVTRDLSGARSDLGHVTGAEMRDYAATLLKVLPSMAVYSAVDMGDVVLHVRANAELPPLRIVRDVFVLPETDLAPAAR